MKKLVKIKLINWQSFSNQTIEVKDNCLITGRNGAGKSTLLDAIQFVLTAGKAKFNKAADDTSKRTIETYARGKVSFSNKEYLREGDVTSYIALEFYDDNTKRYDILGAVIEVTTLAKPNKLFFKLSNQRIEDSLFIVNDVTRTLNQFRKLVSDGDRTESSSLFQSMIRSFLGITGKDRYFELLTKSVAFESIKDINGFVNNFLLTEDTISLESLQQNVENLSRLVKEIELEEEKVEKLEIIEEKVNIYQDNQNEKEKIKYFIDKNEQMKLRKLIDNNKLKIKVNEEEIKRKNNEKVEKESKCKKLDLMVREYEISLNNNEEYKLYQKWEQRQEEIRKERESLSIQIQSFEKNIGEEIKLLQPFSWSKSLKETMKDFSDIDKVEEKILKCIRQKESDKKKYETVEFELRHQKEETNKLLLETKEKVSLLERKKMPYKDSVVQLQKAIKDYFKEKQGENIEVRPLCEYLEITDEKWRNAIEGYLNTQRFDLIIEPIYFDEALKIYETYKKEKRIFGVGLVNTQKLANEKAAPNTLSTYISASNLCAERYANHLLNKVVCVSDIKELKKYDNSITSTCMTYKNHVARQINPKVYEEPFIGQKAIERQLEKSKEELHIYEQKYNDLVKSYQESFNFLNILRNSNLDFYKNEVGIFRKYQNLKIEYEENEKYKNELEVNGMFSNVLEKKQKLENDISQLNIEIEEIRNIITKKKVQNEMLENEIENNEELLKNKKFEVNDEWNKVYEEEKKDKSIEQFEKYCMNKLNNLERIISNIENEIVTLEMKYNVDYQFDQIPSIENIKSYLNELYKKREIDIVSRKSKSIELKESCQISFKEDFISKLRDKIESAQSEIKELNKALKDNPFGNENYEFIYEKSKNPEMANYYRIITSGANYQINNLFEENLTLEDQNSLQELFSKISIANTEDKTKRIVEEYTDYRNYMSYDIKITNNNGESYYFSKVLREKSGGELQTPFYVIIAAAFEQLLRSNKRSTSTGCIVMFDEAFNNMDESRIEAMMNFYNKLNIQLLIAVPPEKTYIIAPYVSTTLMLISGTNGAYVKGIRLEEEEDVAI